MSDIMSVLTTLFHILVFPGLLFVCIIGLLLAGIDRKVLAHMQKRVGPPILQPFYDFFKLMGKETIIPEEANPFVYKAAPLVGFASLVVMALFIPVFGYSAFGGNADLIVLLRLRLSLCRHRYLPRDGHHDVL